MSHTSDCIQLLGGNFRVRRQGRGAPLLFLHGMGGAANWLPFFDRLSEHFDLIVPDHPGFGASDAPSWLRGIGDMAYFYLELMAHLNIRGAAVVGSSIGGWIAAEAAIRDPGAFGRMALIAPAGLRVKGQPAGDVFIWTRDELARNLFVDQRFSEAMQAVVLDADTLDVELKNKYTSARLTWEPRLFNPELERWVHRIASPVKIIWGANDVILPSAFANAWLKSLPNGSSDVIPQCGHMPHVEKSEECLGVLLPFLMGS